MKMNERALRKLQKQRHMYDIQQMIMNNPIFKNLNQRDQKKLRDLIYKAEMTEIYLRDRNIVRVNKSFEDIIGDIANMLDNHFDEEEEDEYPEGDERQ